MRANWPELVIVMPAPTPDEIQAKGAALMRGALFSAAGDYEVALRLVSTTLAALTSASVASREHAKLQVKSWVTIGRR